MFHLALGEISHSVYVFPTGSAVTVKVYNLTSDTWEVLDDDNAVEIMDGITGTGFYSWSLDNLHTAPAAETELLTFATDTITVQSSKVKYSGGYVEQIDQIKTQMDNLILSSGGVINIETPWVVGELRSGQAATIVLYDSTGASEALDDDTCSEIGVTGFYFWSTHNMTNYPAVPASFLWVMDDGVRRAYGVAVIGVPESVEDAVWDAKKAAHSDAGSFGESVPADIIQIGHDATAAGYLKLQYNGTGIVGDEFPARQDQIDVTAIENAVWDAVQADHTDPGSTGESLNNTGSGAGITVDDIFDEDLATHLTPGTSGSAIARTLSHPEPIFTKTAHETLIITLDRTQRLMIKNAAPGSVISADVEDVNGLHPLNMAQFSAGRKSIHISGGSTSNSPYTVTLVIDAVLPAQDWSKIVGTIYVETL